MGTGSLPEGVLVRFRELSQERVARVESTWSALTAGIRDPKAIRELLRELHTLKGDARIVSLGEIHQLAHKLEELFTAAKLLDYRLSEDFEIVITMAIQFLGTLVRNSAVAAAGIDLPRFVTQIDEVLREARSLPVLAPHDHTQTRMEERDKTLARISEGARERLAIAATSSFLEYVGARGLTSRHRLRGVWSSLRDELVALRAVPLADLLERHMFAAERIAADLGKRVRIRVDVGSVHLDARFAEAIDIAVVHLVRNAIDHGIESPAVRLASRKDAVGTVVIRAEDHDDTTTITVEDDGAGIDLDAVRARGEERGILTPGADREQVLDVVFRAGFSTRSEVNELSGRGVGLDAVRAALARSGGSVRATTSTSGTMVTLAGPSVARRVEVHSFVAPHGRLAFAVSRRWSATAADAPHAIDPTAIAQIPTTSRQTIELFVPPLESAVRLRLEPFDLVFRTGGPVVEAIADRICPTPATYPLEIVLVDGRETILLRPEYLATTPSQLTRR